MSTLFSNSCICFRRSWTVAWFYCVLLFSFQKLRNADSVMDEKLIFFFTDTYFSLCRWYHHPKVEETSYFFISIKLCRKEELSLVTHWFWFHFYLLFLLILYTLTMLASSGNWLSPHFSHVRYEDCWPAIVFIKAML